MRKPNTSLTGNKEAPSKYCAQRTVYCALRDGSPALANLLTQKHRILSNTGCQSSLENQALQH